MWKMIQNEKRKNRCLVLTTHLMEEADALCSRIGIMVGGKMACLGTPQHLKSRYSTGYELEIKIKGHGSNHRNRLRSFVESLASGSTREVESGGATALQNVSS